MTAGRYRKVGYVLAEQATEPGIIATPEGDMRFEAGDYLVTDAPPTHMWPVKREVFERTYRMEDGFDSYQESVDYAVVRDALFGAPK